MKIKILEYHAYRGNIVKVQSHNLRKGKWIKNEDFERHRDIAYRNGKYSHSPIIWKKEYEVEK